MPDQTDREQMLPAETQACAMQVGSVELGGELESGLLLTKVLGPADIRSMIVSSFGLTEAAQATCEMLPS